jgi:hypothetical protein
MSSETSTDQGLPAVAVLPAVRHAGRHRGGDCQPPGSRMANIVVLSLTIVADELRRPGRVPDAAPLTAQSIVGAPSGGRAHARGPRAREDAGAPVHQGTGVRLRDGQDVAGGLRRDGGAAAPARHRAHPAARRQLRLPRADRARAGGARPARPRSPAGKHHDRPSPSRRTHRQGATQAGSGCSACGTRTTPTRASANNAAHRGSRRPAHAVCWPS